MKKICGWMRKKATNTDKATKTVTLNYSCSNISADLTRVPPFSFID